MCFLNLRGINENSLPLLKFSAEAHSSWELKFPSSQTVLWLRTVPLLLWFLQENYEKIGL